MKKYFFRPLSIILAIIMLFQAAPLHSFAAAAPIPPLTEAPTAPDMPYEPVRHVEEDVSLRTADTKHIKNEGGSSTAYVYPHNIHFLDENGNYQEIDNTLVLKGDFYVPKASGTDIALPNVLGGSKAIRVSTGGFGFSLGVPSANSPAIVPEPNGLENAFTQQILQSIDFSKLDKDDLGVDMPVELINQQISAVRNQQSAAYYLDAFPGADLQYILQSDQIKENIYVREKQKEYAYRFQLGLENLVAVQQDERTIHLFSAQTGDLKAKIEAPYATDAAGALNTQAVTLSLDGNTLTVTADAKWMNENDREFPVTLDPSYVFVVDAWSMPHASVNNLWQRNNPMNFQLDVGTRKGIHSGRWIDIGVKNTSRSYLRFDVPPLPNDAVVTQASILLDDNSTPAWAKGLYWLLDWAGNAGLTDFGIGEFISKAYYWFFGQIERPYTANIRAEKVIENWGALQMLWANRPKTSGVALSIGEPYTYPDPYKRWQKRPPNGVYEFDITDAVKDWIASDGADNYGIMLRAEDEEKDQENFLEFASLSSSFTIDTSLANQTIDAILPDGLLTKLIDYISGSVITPANTQAVILSLFGLLSIALPASIPGNIIVAILAKALALPAEVILGALNNAVSRLNDIPDIPVLINPLDTEPTVAIHYISSAGLEDYFSYETVDMGRAGSAYVNHFTGGLTTVHPTVSMAGERMPVGLSHVYTSNHALADGELWNMKVGAGFRLSMFEEVMPINNYEKHTISESLIRFLDSLDLETEIEDELIKILGAPRFYYTLIDGDGTEHRFVQEGQEYDENGKPKPEEFDRSVFVSEVNPKLKMRMEGNAWKKNGGTCIIEDEYGNQKIYEEKHSVGLNDVLDDIDNVGIHRFYRYLTKIRDANGNETNIIYNNGRITKIVDTIGRTISFHYDENGYLTSLVDPAENRTTNFSYDTNTYGVPVLDKITYHDNKATSFTYIQTSDRNKKDHLRTRLTAVNNPDNHYFGFKLTPLNVSRATIYRVTAIQHGIGGTIKSTTTKTNASFILADKDGTWWQKVFYWISKAVFEIVYWTLSRPDWLSIDDLGRWDISFLHWWRDPIFGENEITQTFTFDENVSATLLEYYNSRTKVVNSLGEVEGVTYSFDRAGRAVGARDNTTGENAFISYTSSGGVQNLPGFAAGAAVVRNLLQNPSNESSSGKWTGGTLYEGDAFAGQRSWKVSPSSYNGLVYSSEKLEKDATYTLSLFAKALSGSPAATLYYGDGNSFPLDLSDQWDRFTVTFKHESSGYFGFSIATVGGDILVDAVQLEKNEAASPFNLIANSHFDYELKPDEWEIVNGDKDLDQRQKTKDKGGKDVYEVSIQGHPDKEKALLQEIRLSPQMPNQMLLFGATASVVSARKKAEKARVSAEFINRAGNTIELIDDDAKEEEEEQLNNVQDNRAFVNFNRDIRPSFPVNKGDHDEKWYSFLLIRAKKPYAARNDAEQGIQTVATAYLIPEDAVAVKLYISYDNQSTAKENAIRVQDAFAYIGAGGTNFDYLDGKISKATMGSGTANYSWNLETNNLDSIEIRRAPTRKETEGPKPTDVKIAKIDYAYDTRHNVLSSVESKGQENGQGNYLVTKTIYNYKAALTNSYNRGSGSLTAQDIGGILTGSSVMTYASADGKEPVDGVMPLANAQTVEYINDCNDVKKVMDGGTEQWVEYDYLSKEHNIPTRVSASDGSISTYHYNEFASAAPNALDVLTSIRAHNGEEDTEGQYKNNYDYTGFGSSELTLSGLLRNIKHNDTTYAFDYNLLGQNESVKIGAQTLVTNTYYTEEDETETDPTIRRYSLAKTEYQNKDKSGNKFTLEPVYDERGRVIAERWNSAATPNVKYIYSNSGVLSRVEDADVKRETQFGYDMQGRLTDIFAQSTDSAATNRVRLGFGDDGELVDFRLTVNGTPLSQTQYAYDIFDRPSTTTLTSLGNKTLSFNYNAQTSRLQSTALSLDIGEAKTEFAYNDDKQTTVDDTIANLAGSVKQMSTVLPGGSFTYDYIYVPQKAFGAPTVKYGGGNIETISENGVQQHSYAYDSIGQLISDTTPAGTTTYTYDLGGNLKTISEPGKAMRAFDYTNASWKDQLTVYYPVAEPGQPGKVLTYDEIGNLKTYDEHTYEWKKARQLASISGPVINASYTYDYTGLRSSKTVGAAKTEYIWAGGLLMHQNTYENGYQDPISWSYDAAGKMLGFAWRGGSYFYIRNLQGDIVAIHDTAGNIVAQYKYDAWGNQLTEQVPGSIGEKNPIRYRGYYYDTETGYYYCQSRYYNPEWCRWISADVYMDTGDGIMGTNMYAYCQGDPVNGFDPSGMASTGTQVIFDLLTTFALAMVIYNEDRGADYLNGQWSIATIMWNIYTSLAGGSWKFVENEFDTPNINSLELLFEPYKAVNAALLAAKLVFGGFTPKPGLEGFTQNRSVAHFNKYTNSVKTLLTEPQSGGRKAEVWRIDAYITIGDNVYFKGEWLKVITL